MTARDLRIGNLVSDGTFIYFINRIGIGVVEGEIFEIHKYSKAETEDFYKQGISYSLNIENVSPIPLTEEWLLKFEFIKHGAIWINPNTILISIYNRAKTEGVYHYIAGREQKDYFLAVSEQIKYVHRLQNIWFDLTDNELIRKL